MDNGLILEPEEDLFCDFKSMSLIPIFDCYDNNYLCYDYDNNQWCIFNSIDESPYDKNTDILKLYIFEED